jgi:hypothetical protein
MTAAEFKKKWSRFQGKETSAYQGHFDDLCRLLGHSTRTDGLKRALHAGGLSLQFSFFSREKAEKGQAWRRKEEV